MSAARARPFGSAQGRPFGSAQGRQVWTIAKIELRRVFFARRGLWIYALALLPCVMFVGHAIDVSLRKDRLTARGLTNPALMETIRDGEVVTDVKERLGQPAEERWSVRSEFVRQRTATAGTTSHGIEPVPTRFVRLNIIQPSQSG